LKVAIVNAADYAATHDGEFTFDVFRRTISRRLHLLDPLRYQLVDIPWKLHHPMWLENCPVDLDYHLRRVRVPNPGGRRERDEVIGQIASTPLDRSRPLWEFHFAEGMADDRFALIGKVHHTLADGVASANLLARLMDLAGSEQNEREDREDREDYVTCAPPSRMQLLAEAQRDHFDNMAALPRLISDAVRGVARVRKRNKERADHPDIARIFQAPPTFLNHVVSPVRTVASSASNLSADYPPSVSEPLVQRLLAGPACPGLTSTNGLVLQSLPSHTRKVTGSNPAGSPRKAQLRGRFRSYRSAIRTSASVL
jgi:diacylglycerol O-acyltransferase / wax synthase